MTDIPDDQSKSQPDQKDIEKKIVDDSSSPKNLRFRAYKDVILLGMAFLLQYSGYFGIGNLQSSLNADDNVGVNSLFISYSCAIASSIFLPHPIIGLIGNKWTLFAGQIP